MNIRKKAASFLASVLLVVLPAGVVFAATSIGNNVSVGGTLSAGDATTLTSATLSSTLGVTGLSTLAGFISSASSTVKGSLNVNGALNASSSLLATGSLIMNQTAGTFNLGKFYVDSDGVVSASSTLGVAGNSTLGDSDAAGGDSTRVFGTLAMGLAPTGRAQLLIQATSTIAIPLSVLGSDGTQILSAVSSTNSILSNQTTNATLQSVALLTLGNNTTLSGIARFKRSTLSASATGLELERSSGVIGSALYHDGLYMGLSGGTATTTLKADSLIFDQTSGYNLGKFYADSSGNVSASGTLGVTSLATLSGGFIAPSSTVTGSFTAAGPLNASSSIIATGSLTMNQTAGTFNLGKFYADASGNVSASGTLLINSNTLVASATKVGVVSSTPYGQLSVGAGGAVTSTISVGKFCMYAGQEDGTNVYIVLGKNQPNNQPFATTTVSCF